MCENNLKRSIKGPKEIKLIAWRLINGRKNDVRILVSEDIEDVKTAKENFKNNLRKANIVFDGVDVVK